MSILGGGNPVIAGLLPVAVVVAVVCAIRFIPAIVIGTVRRRHFESIGIHDVDSMKAKELELFLEIRFRARGYSVLRSENHGDWCSDLILEKDDVQTVVQSKRYEKDVTIRGIKEAEAARQKYRCANLVVVTNRKFTTAAVELATSNSIELWDRKRLIAELLAVSPEDIWETAVRRPATTPGEAPKAIAARS